MNRVHTQIQSLTTGKLIAAGGSLDYRTLKGERITVAYRPRDSYAFSIRRHDVVSSTRGFKSASEVRDFLIAN